MTQSIGGDGVARRFFRVPAGLHRVGDEACIASLAYQLDTLVSKAWVAAVILSDGTGSMRTANVAVRWPSRGVQSQLVGIAIALNGHEAQDGHWVVALNTAENELVALWRDRDGDVQAVWEIGDPNTVADWTDLDFAAQAHAALATMREQHAKVDVRPHETTPRALRRDRVSH